MVGRSSWSHARIAFSGSYAACERAAAEKALAGWDESMAELGFRRCGYFTWAWVRLVASLRRLWYGFPVETLDLGRTK
jgi:hypothetical protein